MGKNKERYKYLEVGLERESWTLAQLERDARDHQMSEHLAHLVVLRLTEYYHLIERGVIVQGLVMKQTRATAPTPVPQETPSKSRQARSNESGAWKTVKQAESELPEMIIMAVSEDAGKNADDALDYFLDDEE